MVTVDKGETVASLKAKVQAIESELYLNSIREIIDARGSDINKL